VAKQPMFIIPATKLLGGPGETRILSRLISEAKNIQYRVGLLGMDVARDESGVSVVRSFAAAVQRCGGLWEDEVDAM
jgi:hypothetical protein